MSFRELVPIRATRCGEAYARVPPLLSRAELCELSGRMLDDRMVGSSAELSVNAPAAVFVAAGRDRKDKQLQGDSLMWRRLCLRWHER